MELALLAKLLEPLPPGIGRGAATQAERRARGQVFTPPTIVEAMLALRRNRGRYALVFALMGVAAGSGAVAASGLGAALSLSFGHGLLALALGFVSAWLILGEAACSQSAIRRALLGGRERT
mgnify:CR=1 FL=1